MSQDGGKELRLHLSYPELRQAAQREIEEAETPPSVGVWPLAWLRASFARAEVHHADVDRTTFGTISARFGLENRIISQAHIPARRARSKSALALKWSSKSFVMKQSSPARSS
jgi:hypothetical protein